MKYVQCQNHQRKEKIKLHLIASIKPSINDKWKLNMEKLATTQNTSKLVNQNMNNQGNINLINERQNKVTAESEL